MEFSMSMPQIFLSLTYMSLGHLIFALMEWAARKSTTERAAISFIENWSYAWKWGPVRSSNFRAMLKRRFFPRALCHLFPLCPLPAVCSKAAVTDKLSMSQMCLLSSSLVESVLSSHIMSCFFVMVRFLIICLRLGHTCLRFGKLYKQA